MLVARRAAPGGCLLAFGFHFALAMDPGDVVFNFSAALVALFFLFLPDRFPPGALFDAGAASSDMGVPAQPAACGLCPGRVVYVLTPALFASLIFRQAIATGLTQEASRAVWVVYAGFVLRHVSGDGSVATT